ncbi:two-component response regulator-like APRR1 [Bidens hawaiensis]|uniref:two-component response regulator-like APRR1 n=1 Tax=Bidens hawaiensis TaxID=980011 RepID=UPI00404AD239
MDPNEILLSRGNTNGEGFIDRSKVRILLCDNDTKSSQEVVHLLCKCSYQVTSVRSPRQVIDALNAEGPDIDVILSEVDLPMAKGFKMLKYIMRDKDLRRIPVIMMSAQDEVALVVKCLRLGAADYLVKPLRTNELLNLWTHMWRRKRMLGLAEKNIMNCEFDLVHSDHSEANTNSTTLFSDDTDDKSLKISNPEISVSIPQENETNLVTSHGFVSTPLVDLSDDLPNVPEINEQRAVFSGKVMFGPKKSELKIGQSSAFFTYVKSNISRGDPHADELNTPPLNINPTHENIDHEENLHINNTPRNSLSADRSPAPPNPTPATALLSSSIQMNYNISEPQQSVNNNYHHDASGYNTYNPYPYYLSGPMNHHVMMSSASSIYQQNMNIPPHHMSGMTSFPYYPVNLCLPGQMPHGMPTWHSYKSSSNNNAKGHTLDRREAALIKFRQKRKERCFDKKIRYVNKKKLAERRPRVRGQFVRKVNGINVDLNGQPTSTDLDDEDDEDDEDEEDPTGSENNYAVFSG